MGFFSRIFNRPESQVKPAPQELKPLNTDIRPILPEDRKPVDQRVRLDFDILDDRNPSVLERREILALEESNFDQGKVVYLQKNLKGNDQPGRVVVQFQDTFGLINLNSKGEFDLYIKGNDGKFAKQPFSAENNYKYRETIDRVDDAGNKVSGDLVNVDISKAQDGSLNISTHGFLNISVYRDSMPK